MSMYAERIARVESEVQGLKDSFEDHKKDTNQRFDRIEGKLDNLLALRNKGAGVFWLISILVGTGLLTAGSQFLSWLLGKH